MGSAHGRCVCGEAPTEAQRERFREFARRYPELEPALASVLFNLYAPYLDELDEGLPRPANPAEIWGMVDLGSITLEADGSLQALHGFHEGLWDDAMFGVGFEGWTPVGIGLDD